MRIKEIAFRIHIHRVHASRLARSGIIPGTKQTKGGHYYFVESRALNRWINFMKSSGAFRRKEMARAYAKHYGSEKIKRQKEHGYYSAIFRKEFRELKKYDWNISDENYFNLFAFDIYQLIAILKEVTRWKNKETKSEMIKASREPIAALRDLINVWLKED